jgi:cytoskeletal protein CcmA (bactofilin family)
MLKIKGLAAEDLNGFLDEGTELSGELRFRDVMRVDGRIKGRIVSDNTLIIGETGQVDAEIDCGVGSIRGKVTGQVHGRKRIELLCQSPHFLEVSSHKRKMTFPRQERLEARKRVCEAGDENRSVRQRACQDVSRCEDGAERN